MHSSVGFQSRPSRAQHSRKFHKFYILRGCITILVWTNFQKCKYWGLGNQGPWAMSGIVDGDSHEKFRLIGSRFTFSRSWKPNLETSFGQSVINCLLCGQRGGELMGTMMGCPLLSAPWEELWVWLCKNPPYRYVRSGPRCLWSPLLECVKWDRFQWLTRI